MSAVLVVEDDPFSLFTMTEMLEELGHDWISADSGEAGLRAIAARGDEVDLVLMDIHMPGISGLEVARSIRGAGAHPPRDLPLAAVSADPVWQNQQHARASGFDMALPKPVSMEALEAAVKRLLAL